MDESAEKAKEHRKRAADIRMHAQLLTDASCRAAMVSVAEGYERLATALEKIAKRALARTEPSPK